MPVLQGETLPGRGRVKYEHRLIDEGAPVPRCIARPELTQFRYQSPSQIREPDVKEQSEPLRIAGRRENMDEKRT
jgi:hypothetical protein